MSERTPDEADIQRAAAPDIGGVAGVLSAREAAMALEISERTIRRAIARGDLVTTKHAGSYQITPAALDDYRRRLGNERTGPGPRHRSIPAAAPDVAAGQARAARLDSAAAPDTEPAAQSAPSVEVDLAPLAAVIERQGNEIRQLTEAAAVWQFRALQAEERLKALTAGESEQNTAESRQDVLGTAAGANAPNEPSGLQKWWARLWGRS